MTLNKARILSSENDASVKQEQNTNINIKIKPPLKTASVPMSSNSPSLNSSNVNFTQMSKPCNATPTMTTQSIYQSQPQINSPPRGGSECPQLPSVIVQERGIADIGNEIDELETKNKFLEMIIEMYEDNPLKINSYLICKNELLMNMIKLLTDCDKVEIVIDDCEASCGCLSTNEKSLMKITKILITKDDKTEDFKYKYNDIYTQFIKYGISLKLTT